MSKKTTAAERKFSSYELETLAVVNALKKFRTYLLGLHFKIITDCAAFAMTLGKKDLVSRIARFDYKIEHRPGNRMKHADALSRNSIMTVRNELTYRLRKIQNEDETLRPIIALLKENIAYDDYVLQNDVLYKVCDDTLLLVIPKRMEHEIIRDAHDNNGHFSIKKTTDVIMKEFWFQRMTEKIRRYIQNCVKCILVNRKSGKHGGWVPYRRCIF